MHLGDIWSLGIREAFHNYGNMTECVIFFKQWYLLRKEKEVSYYLPEASRAIIILLKYHSLKMY